MLDLDKYLRQAFKDIEDAVGVSGFFGKTTTVSNQIPRASKESPVTKPQFSREIISESDLDLPSLFRAFKDPKKLARQFTAYNKSFYKQTYDADSFFHAFMKDYLSDSYLSPIKPNKFRKYGFFYLFGIPVLLVDRLPYDNHEDNIQIGGNRSEVGIICVLANNLIEIARHEIMHCIVAWLKVIKVFKLSIMSEGSDQHENYRKKVLTHIRDEMITYLTANPSMLSERPIEFPSRSVSGLSLNKLKSIFTSDYTVLKRLLEGVMIVDRGYPKMSREKLCQILMFHTDCESIILSFNSHVNNN
jgi:hypothetical protein